MDRLVGELGGCSSAVHKFRDAAIFMKGGMGRDRATDLEGPCRYVGIVAPFARQTYVPSLLLPSHPWKSA